MRFCSAWISTKSNCAVLNSAGSPHLDKILTFSDLKEDHLNIKTPHGSQFRRKKWSCVVKPRNHRNVCRIVFPHSIRRLIIVTNRLIRPSYIFTYSPYAAHPRKIITAKRDRRHFRRGPAKQNLFLHRVRFIRI